MKNFCNLLNFKIIIILLSVTLQLSSGYNIRRNEINNNFIDAIKNFQEEHNQILKLSNNNKVGRDDKFLRFLEGEEKEKFSENLFQYFFNSEDEYESYNCKIRPNKKYGQPFGLFPELLGKLRNKDDVRKYFKI